MPRYKPADIEPKWQAYWEQHRVFATPTVPGKKKRYILDMFPYPSGDGLHVGHPEGYTATDIVARFSRMRGESVLHPMGFDAFGLPAEEHAIKTGEHPRVQTQRNIDNFTRQLKMLGFSYDWDRCLATTDEDYFRWTQYIFLVLYDTWFDNEAQKGRPISELKIPAEIQSQGRLAIESYRDRMRLAYQDDALVNWCAGLGTVLANEEVIDGRSERGDHPVQRIPLRQWMLRITDYAERLIDGLDELHWPEGIKKLQSDWIGRSTGAEVDFYVGPRERFDAWKAARQSSGYPEKCGVDALRVYTTRPDTLFGATYMVIAPEHTMVHSLTTSSQSSAVTQYCQAASFKSDRQRTEAEGSKHKTGVFTGSYAINPVDARSIPIWVADYVLAGYGTGAIMAVPAHDDRDFEFAKQFDLPIIAVVNPPLNHHQRDEILAGNVCYPSKGIAIHSGSFDGQETDAVKDAVTSQLESQRLGRQAINYKLRDWLFSRQRFWGEPFPVLHELDDDGNATGVKRAVPLEHLPVKLPNLEDFKPHGRPEPPLAKASDDWLIVTIDGTRYRRETNTMPQWAGSCWYYLRYIDPKNTSALVDPELERHWMPVDLYVGGAEHAVLHLLYSRFWHKVLFDRGYVSTPEPFNRLINQGMILGEPDANGKAEKMSKSRGNVVNPDDIVRDYGADSLRLYEMFMGPLEATKPWSMNGVSGVRNFLDRVWRLIVVDGDEDGLSPAITDGQPDEEQNRMLHQTIRAVTQSTEAMSFNTSIARMMEFTNLFTRSTQRPRSTLLTFLRLLSPYAPHIADELASRLGHAGTLATETWPTWDESALVESTIELAVQINGKVKSKIIVPADATQETVLEIALSDDKVKSQIEGKTIHKKIVVPGRMVNLVVG
jgi:leucyl-tRNA synthetase